MVTAMTPMDVSSDSADMTAVPSSNGPIYSNPVVSNEKPKLEDYPQLFSSLGLPAREDWA